ncbi:hypothetical protein SAMN05444144_102331 [Flavobacterium akiainvivens]|nr:hypothetical protein SAMN05444144_102331 [Flavobacterium akiainvivens]
MEENIPEWHKDIVLNRMANAKEEDYVDWNEAKLRIRRHNNRLKE